MITTLHAVALRTVRYNDRQSILSAWTAEAGRMSFAMSESNSAEARRRRALSMPMSMFEAVADIRPGRDIVTIRDMRPWPPTPNTATHPVRAAVAMFVAEVLSTTLRDAGAPDAHLYAFIASAARDIDTLPTPALAKYPLWFLHRLSIPLGFEPDFTEAAPGTWFDMRRGTFTPAPDPNVRDVADYRSMRPLLLIARMQPGQLQRLRLSSDIRKVLMNKILDYYTIHFTNMRNLRSLPVLEALFH